MQTSLCGLLDYKCFPHDGIQELRKVTFRVARKIVLSEFPVS